VKTKIVTVTPSMAQEWLEKNVDNRPIRHKTVEGMAQAIRRGEWVLSHQGIAFGKSGNLVDGQHRLSAIVEAGRAVPMMVTWDVDDGAFQVTDLGLRRSVSDIMSIPLGLAAVARVLAVVEDRALRTSLTPQYLAPFVRATERPYAAMNAFCAMTSKTWSSSSVRAAAIIRMLDGADENYILMTYHALCHLDYDSMPPIAKALMRQKERGTLSTSNFDMFVRCLKVFNPAEASQRTIQIVSNAPLLAYAREVIAREIHGQKKAPAAKASGAKKTVNVKPNYTAASA
jgi:hypothetical protein